MRKTDLRFLLQSKLIANTNTPASHDDAAQPPQPQQEPRPRPSAPPIRPHRALRPRRRS